MSENRTRIALVVGGTRGIGLEITRQLAADGFRVVASARKPRPETDGLDEVEYVQADMSDPAAPDQLIGQVAERHGRIDVLVNNVGGGYVRKDAAAVTDQQWLQMLNSSFLYAVRTSRAVVPIMRAQGSGCIINISSISGRMGDAGVIDYAAAKAALDNYTKSLSIALAPSGIRVNVVAPGPVMTPLWTDPGGLADQFAEVYNLPGEDAMKEFAKHVPLGRFALPSEVAAMVAFLASNKAEYITGTNIRVDGGMLTAV